MRRLGVLRRDLCKHSLVSVVVRSAECVQVCEDRPVFLTRGAGRTIEKNGPAVVTER